MKSEMTLSLALIFAVFAVTTQACQGFTVPPTDDSVLEIGGEKFFIYDGPALEWLDAAALCRSLGMQLVSFETKEKWEAVREVLLETEFVYNSFWTSGVLVPGVSWVWASLGEPLSFTAWGPGQPSNAFGNEYCLEMHGLDSEWWHDYPCGDGYRSKAVCEMACKNATSA